VKAPKGFTIIELLLVFAFFGIMAGIVSIPLAGLLSGNALRDGAETVKDSLRRAQLQAMAGYHGTPWGIHFSDTDGCALPATSIHIFKGTTFTSATDTLETVELPDGASVTALAFGGGCDVVYTRFEGTTSSSGTITVSDSNGNTRPINVNAYGRVTQ
jgi:type II secretory pathway pseudopilin PulG